MERNQKSYFYYNFTAHHHNWENRFFELLEYAKQRPEWQNYYPFLSHMGLKFSLDVDLIQGWDDLRIMPLEEVNQGNYLVQISNENFYFNEMENAVEFYAKKL